MAAVFLGTLLPALLRYSAADLARMAGTPGGAFFLALSAMVWISSLSGRGAYWPNVTTSRSTQLFRVGTAALLAWAVVTIRRSA